MSRSLIIVGLAGALVSASSAMAQDQTNIRVGYGDRNLDARPGAEVLQQRIQDALTEICGTASVRDIGALTLVRGCRESASIPAER